MYDECKRLGIPYPEIEWIGSITIRGEEHYIGGLYQYETQEILMSINMINIMLEKGRTESDITKSRLSACFHELKHYIDDKLHKVTLQEFRQNHDRYEAEAKSYAEELMKRVEGGKFETARVRWSRDMDVWYPSMEADPSLHIMGPEHTDDVYLIRYVNEAKQLTEPVWTATSIREAKARFREALELLERGQT